MTYNEFMKDFRAFVEIKVKHAISEYPTAKEAAEAFNVSESSLSRLTRGIGTHLDTNTVKNILGKDIFDAEIRPAKELEIEFLEQRLKKLKGEV